MRWMAAQSTYTNLNGSDPVSTARLLDSRRTDLWPNSGTTGFRPTGWISRKAIRWNSYADFVAAISASTIDPTAVVMVFDIEAGTGDATEILNPPLYMNMFCDLAHANGYIAVTTPSRDLCQVVGSVYTKNVGETLSDAYIRNGVAADGARYADVFEIQMQVEQNNAATYAYYVQQAADQAHGANPNIEILSGLSASIASTTGALMEAAAAAVRGMVAGYFLNVTSGTASIGVDFIVAELAVTWPPLVPELFVELDTGDLLNGAKLDDAASAQLDTAILEYSSPTFAQDITDFVRGGSTQRGAQRELQRVEAGGATLELDNRDGRFTPFNASSPYFPDVLPMRRIRIRATFSAVTYPVFYGYVEGWPVTFPGETDTVVTVSLVDGFKLLSLALVSGDFPQQSSSDRVSAVLSAAGWTGGTDLDTGTVTVPAVTLDNVSALEHIQQIEHAEGGRFFIGRDGLAVFRNRNAQANPDFSTRTWADDGSGMSYRNVVLTFDDELILNDIHLNREGGTEQVAFDSPSQGSYGIRSTAETGIQLTTDGDVSDLADLMLERYKEPVLRLESLVDNAMQHGLWDRVLDRELNDIALAIESRTAAAQVSTIEGLAHDIGRDGSWTVTLSLSPTVIVQAGILDDSTYGLLDTTAILAR